MTKDELVSGLKKILVDLDTNEHRQGLESAEITPKTDEYGVKVISFYQSLDQAQKEALFALLKQIRIDTIASLFAFLDGSFFIEGQTADMRLVNLANPDKKLNEDLADIFLNLVCVWNR